MHEAKAILIVVGAHLQAEIADRPIAYNLRDRMIAAMTASRAGQPQADAVIVCTDVWYLNTDDLRLLPTVSIGGPAVNALTAYLGDKIPSALAIEGEFVVQYDVETNEPSAACWGVDRHGTQTAVDAFASRFLTAFIRAAEHS
jgi:hypothetical protein